jgi:hypothetical protein
MQARDLDPGSVVREASATPSESVEAGELLVRIDH